MTVLGKVFSRAALVALGSLLLTAAPALGAAGPVDRAFPGGTISQLAINDGPTEGWFADLSFQYSDCGKAAGETACHWRIDVGLAPEGAELCPSASNPLIWSSGEQSGNGAVSSGPQSFGLRGTPGQVLCVLLTRTSEGEWEGGKFKNGGLEGLEAVLMGPELISPIEAIERKIINASPAASVAPPPLQPSFRVDSSCRRATVGNAVYVFVYRQLGCRKAKDLASMAHLSGTAPNGYRCAARASGGMRCWRRGHPRKYVEWHVPGWRAADST
ncbi:MAG TPA: hypothetical protein VFR04_00805 [Solirubrobacterales bacterium]|nr:hypothetical protein [Solirubrobacterales bacterium]